MKKYIMFVLKLMLLSIFLIILGVILSMWTPSYTGIIVSITTGLPLIGLLLYAMVSFDKSELLLNKIAGKLFIIDVILNLFFS